MPTIALVDDDRNILTSVSIALEGEGYRVQTYTDGASALDGLKTNPPDLAIFDIKMPRMDGMELLRRLRQKSDLPVIFLTSKDEEIDELFGLKMGADDFIRKPFSQRLLVERVKAILRRANPKEAAAQKESEAKILERGLLKMDPERHTCTWKNEPVTLTVTEFLILQALATRPGVVKSRNALMDAAYDDQVYVDDRTIDSHIKRLRKKFKAVDDDFDEAVLGQRLIVLRNLVALGKIRVVVLLSIPFGESSDLTVQSQRGFDRQVVSLAVQDRKCPRQAQADGTCLNVRIVWIEGR